jgi:hypothetical protein
VVAMPQLSAWVAAADAIERASIGDGFYRALFTGQLQTDRLIMRARATSREGRANIGPSQSTAGSGGIFPGQPLARLNQRSY